MALRNRIISATAAVGLVLGVAGPSVGLASPVPPPIPATITALGDSITVGFDATRLLMSQPEYSWATGNNSVVNSVGRQLKVANPALTSRNVAVTGATAGGLLTQSAKVTPGPGTDLVTVLIGANDACTSTVSGMTTEDSFRKSVRDGFTKLADLGVEQVVVASIPDVKLLWEVGRLSASARFTWGVFGICQSMLAKPLSTHSVDVARRDQVRNRVIAFNAILGSECQLITRSRANTTACRFDDNAVFNTRFVLSDISSVDFFHPSPTGQAKIAAAVYGKTGYPLG